MPLTLTEKTARRRQARCTTKKAFTLHKAMQWLACPWDSSTEVGIFIMWVQSIALVLAYMGTVLLVSMGCNMVLGHTHPDMVGCWWVYLLATAMCLPAVLFRGMYVDWFK